MHMTVIFEGRPIATDDSVAGDDGLEDAAIVVGTVSVLWRQHNIAGLIANEIFIVGWNQK